MKLEELEDKLKDLMALPSETEWVEFKEARNNALTDAQKSNFIRNLLQEMRREGLIRPVQGKRGRGAKWELSKKSSD